MPRIATNNGIRDDGNYRENRVILPTPQQVQPQPQPQQPPQQQVKQEHQPIPFEQPMEGRSGLFISPYTGRIIKLVCIVLATLSLCIGIIWFNANMGKMAEKNYGTDIPVTSNVDNTYNNNHTISTKTDNYNEHIANTYLNITTTNEIKMPDEFKTELVNDIVDGVLDGINESWNNTG